MGNKKPGKIGFKGVKMKVIFLILLLLNSGLNGLNADSKKGKKIMKKPYALSAEMTVENSSIYENAGLEYEFENKSEKNVKAFTIVFYVFDEEEGFLEDESGCVCLEVFCQLSAWDSIEDCISLDGFFSEVLEDACQLDYLYVSRITYADGSFWEDPSGRYAIYF